MKPLLYSARYAVFFLFCVIGLWSCGGAETDPLFEDDPTAEASPSPSPTVEVSPTPTAEATPEATPESTPEATATPVSTATPTPPPVTLAQIQSQIFTPTCAVSGCHTGSPLAGQLNLSDGQSFSSLVGVASVGNPAAVRVVVGNPDQSYLVQKLEGAAGIVGMQMPRGADPLSPAQIGLVRSWITAGAAEATGQSAQVVLTKVAAGPESLSYTIELSGPIDSASLTAGSALLYFVSGEERIPGDLGNTSMEVSGNQLLVEYLGQPPTDYDSIELYVNDPAFSALLDENGQYADMDSDGEPGGMLIHVFP